MKKKRNVIKRNSGFIIGCILAAGASFATADTFMKNGISITTPSEEQEETKATKEVPPESKENKMYETDAFTVTASGNIIKGVETEPVKKEETETTQTDKNGDPIESGTDENGDSSEMGQVEGTDDASAGSEDGSSSGNGSDGGSDIYIEDSYSSGSSDGSSSGNGSYNGDSGYSDGGSGQAIEIYDPGNGDYYYNDSWSGGSTSSGSSSSGSASSGSSSSGSASSGSSSSTPSDVILWGISSRYIDESELYNYSEAELRLIRNEIFALHGRIFNSQDLMDYFSQKSWYVPTYSPEEFDANMFAFLNDYEEANLNVILNYEAALAGN